MATAAAITLAEVELLAQTGQLTADFIHTPGIYVDRIFEGRRFEKRIERGTTRPKLAAAARAEV